MLNYDGIIYRIWTVGGILVLLGITLLLMGCFGSKSHRDKKLLRAALVSLITAVLITAFFLFKLFNPAVASHEGHFIRSNRKSGAPFQYEFVFSTTNPKDPNPVFYLDSFSKRKIFPSEFDKNVRYRIYYEETTKIILGVEILEE